MLQGIARRMQKTFGIVEPCLEMLFKFEWLVWAVDILIANIPSLSTQKFENVSRTFEKVSKVAIFNQGAAIFSQTLTILLRGPWRG